jgi:hypothetical protein
MLLCASMLPPSRPMLPWPEPAAGVFGLRIVGWAPRGNSMRIAGLVPHEMRS